MCMIGKCWAKLRHKIILVQDMSIVVGNHNMVWPLYVHATRVLKTSQNNDLVVNNAHKLLWRLVGVAILRVAVVGKDNRQ